MITMADALPQKSDQVYAKHVCIQDEAAAWERRLAVLTESLQNLNTIQRKWVYLEPIFARGALPSEQQRFKLVRLYRARI